MLQAPMLDGLAFDVGPLAQDAGGIPAYFGYRLDTKANAPGVPEPATWALMIGGFGLAGAALRRRRSVVSA